MRKSKHILILIFKRRNTLHKIFEITQSMSPCAIHEYYFSQIVFYFKIDYNNFNYYTFAGSYFGLL